MPFGLMKSPTIFERMRTEMFGDVPSLPLYIHDIVVRSMGVEEHVGHLKTSCDRVKSAGLKLNLTKCAFSVDKFEVLEHLFKEKGVREAPEKIDNIMDTRLPHSRRELRFSAHFTVGL